MEIIIQEESAPALTPGTGDWAAFEEAVNDLEGYDFEAVQSKRVE